MAADRMTQIVEPFLARADQVLPPGYTALLYGSLARGDFADATSDVNLLLIVPEVSPQLLRTLAPALVAWRKGSVEPPLIVSRLEWSRATDVFPLEITDMRSAHRLLRGPDPLAGVEVSRTELRRAVERELRGKLLRLRQGYAALADHPNGLGALASRTMPVMLLLFRALLELAGRPVADPADARATALALGALVGFDPGPVAAVAAQRGRREWSCPADLFEGYLEAVARTVRYVDQLQPGDQ